MEVLILKNKWGLKYKDIKNKIKDYVSLFLSGFRVSTETQIHKKYTKKMF